MSYAPTTWIEKVTKLGPTNMNHLEQGVATADATANAALPTPAGTNGQFLKKVGGVWVPTSFAASDIPAYPADATKVLLGDGTWGAGRGPYTAYTPTWTAAGTAPAIGNSTVVAFFNQTGKRVHAYGKIVFGSTATYGTSGWRFALPVAASANSMSAEAVGGYMGGGAAYNGNYALTEGDAASTTTVRFLFAVTYLGALNEVNSLGPFTWAVGNILAWSLVYEAA